MAVQYSVAVRNAILDAIEVAIGALPNLRFYTGAQPANCAAAATGTLIASLPCPTDWMNDAAAGTKSKTGVWTATASATGTAGYYRIYDTANVNCHEQGTVTVTGGGGDFTLDNVSVTSGQTITVSTKTITAANA